MKKTVLLLVVAFSLIVTTPATAQKWTLTAETPLPLNLINKVQDYEVLGNRMYLAMLANTKTTIISYDLTTQVVDTLPNGIDLPITFATITMAPDSVLWVTGAGVGSDSVIWRSSIATGAPTPFENVWGPKFRPGTAKYARVRSVAFLGDDVYFAGRWDSLGTTKAPNLLKWSKSTQQFSVPPQASLVNVNAQPLNSAPTAYFLETTKPGELLLSLPARRDSVLVITGSTTGYIEKFSVPVIAGYTNGSLYNAVYYKNAFYYTAVYMNPSTSELLLLVILRKNADNSVETLAQLPISDNASDDVVDWDFVGNKLIITMGSGTATDTIHNIRFNQVMAFDSINFTTIIDTVSDVQGFRSVFDKCKRGLLFNGGNTIGAGVTYANGVNGVGFFRITYSDTTAPIITLMGNDTILLPKGTVYTEPGATAFDNEDGDLTGAIQITGTVDTSIPGTYIITYTVTDASGNTATTTRTIIVEQPNSITEAAILSQVTVLPDRLVITPQQLIRITVITVSGQMITDAQYTANTTVQFNDWAKGIYFMIMNNTTVRKFAVY
jgi:hypothetical protein